jgi:GntP family gluconate:H+ symporter
MFYNVTPLDKKCNYFVNLNRRRFVLDYRALMALCSMVAIFILMPIISRISQRRFPTTLSLLLAAVVAAAIAGFGFPIRHLVEGEFGYFNIVLVILTGVIFLKTIESNGSLEGIMKDMVARFSRFPVLILFAAMILLYLPGMVTGLGVPAVVTSGALVAPILLAMGMPKSTAAAFIALEACFGSVTGPVNIPAMIIAGGVNMPFEGFGRVMPMISVPLGIITALILGLRYASRTDGKALAEKFKARPGDVSGFGMYLPILVVLALFVLPRCFPKVIPDPVTPLTFVIGTIVGIFCGRKIRRPLPVLLNAVDSPILDIAALLLAVGVLVQISTLTGATGLIVGASLSIPQKWIMFSIIIVLPLLGGALTMLGDAAILGMPFCLALLGRNTIVTTAALGMLCALSQLIPPTAIVGLLAGEVVGENDYKQLMKKTAIPIAVTIFLCFLFLNYANQLAKILV